MGCSFSQSGTKRFALLPLRGADVDKDGDAATNGAYLKYILLPFITHKKAPTPITIGIGAFLVKD